MSEEGGFEVARAYAVVVPDADDFAAQLDEQVGGLQVSVVVVPDASGFASALDEQIGGLSVSVAVTPDMAGFADLVDEGAGGLTVSARVTADMSDFEDAVSEGSGGLSAAITPEAADFAAALDEQAGGMSVDVTVVPDTSGFAEALEEKTEDLEVTVPVRADTTALAADLSSTGAEAALSGLSVRVTPDVADFADALSDETGGLTVSAKVTPDVSGFEDQLDEQVGEPSVTVSVEADTAPAVASIDALEGAVEGAASEASAAGGQFAELTSEFSELSGQLDALEARFGALSGGVASMTSESSAAGDALQSVESNFAAVGEEVESLGSEIASAGGDFSGLDGEIGSVSGMLADLKGNLASAEEAVTEFGQAQFNSVAGVQASEDAIGGATSAAGDLAKAAPEAADAGSGLSGVLGELGSRLSYFAVDPFMWMYAAPVVIEGVSDALKALGSTSDGYTEMLVKQDQATNYNISGYQKMAGQLSQTAEVYSESAKTVSDSAAQWGHDSAAVFASISQGMEQASQQVSAGAVNIGTHISELSSEYGISATQAEQLATAAGVSASQLSGSGAAADAAMAKVQAYANANESATGPVSELTADVEEFGNQALTATARIGGMDDAFGKLGGNFASSQTAMLTVAQDFLNIEAGAHTAGASMGGVNQQSLALQQSFYATIPAIEQTANAMTQAGAPTSAVTAYIQEQIDKLSGLTGGSAAAQQAVQGLQQWEDKLSGSLDTTNSDILKSAQNLQDHFITQLEDAGAKSATTKTDVDELTDSIVATGTKSDSTAAARAALIADLVKSGIEAHQATQDVDAFIKSIGNIPSSKTVSIIETATGTWTINEAQGTAESQGPGGNSRIHSASGGLISGGSGHPRADDIHAMLSHGEYVVQAPAVAKYGPGLLDSINAMHFADGGYAGPVSGLGSFMQGSYSANVTGMEAALKAAVQAGIAAAESHAQASAPKGVTVNFYGTQQPTPEQQQAMMMSLSAAVGVS